MCGIHDGAGVFRMLDDHVNPLFPQGLFQFHEKPHLAVKGSLRAGFRENEQINVAPPCLVVHPRPKQPNLGFGSEVPMQGIPNTVGLFWIQAHSIPFLFSNTAYFRLGNHPFLPILPDFVDLQQVPFSAHPRVGQSPCPCFPRGAKR